jgi:hypothetical protein
MTSIDNWKRTLITISVLACPRTHGTAGASQSVLRRRCFWAASCSSPAAGALIRPRATPLRCCKRIRAARRDLPHQRHLNQRGNSAPVESLKSVLPRRGCFSFDIWRLTELPGVEFRRWRRRWSGHVGVRFGRSDFVGIVRVSVELRVDRRAGTVRLRDARARILCPVSSAERNACRVNGRALALGRANPAQFRPLPVSILLSFEDGGVPAPGVLTSSVSLGCA